MPGVVAAGSRGEREVMLDIVGLGGLAVSGSGAEGVARAILGGLLASGGAEECQVLSTAESLDRLLPWVEPFPGINRVADGDELLRAAEVELLHRARLLDGEGEADFAAHRCHYPDDPLPALLLVTDEMAHAHAGRLRAVLELGSRLGLGALVVGEMACCRARIRVDAGGQLQAASPDSLADTLEGVPLYTLRAEEAGELVATIGAPRRVEVVAHRDLEVDEEPFEVEVSERPLIAVRLLGPYRIEVGGEDVRTGLRSKARELLAFFLLRPAGVSLEAAAEALWPEAGPGRGPEWFWTALGNLRSRLRQLTRQPELNLVERAGEIYRIDQELFDVDLWRFEAGLMEARRARDDAAAMKALEAAAEAYGGDLLEGAFYEWADVPREDVRRRAVDALARLGELREGAGDAAGALAALERAIACDPFAEKLYRRVMRLEAGLGKPDAVRRTFRRLEARLAELDVEPDPRTAELLHELLGEGASIVKLPA